LTEVSVLTPASQRNGAGPVERTSSEAFALLGRPFAPEAVRFMATGSYNRDGRKLALVVPFVSRSAVEERLDHAFGPAGWSVAYEAEGEAALCTLRICGIAKQSFGEGSSPWSREANAFKRAARCFGVGRYLTLWKTAHIEVGAGSGQVRQRGKSLIVPESLEETLREAYAERLRRSFVERFGSPIDHFAGAGVPADEGERREAAAANGAEGPPRPEAQSGGAMVAESSGPGADRGVAPAAPERLAGLRSAAADAGYDEETVVAIASVLCRERYLDRLSEPQLELVGRAVEAGRTASVTEQGMRQRCANGRRAISERPDEADEIRTTFARRLAEAARKAASGGDGK